MSHNTLVPASTSKMDILPTTSPPNVRWASEKRAGDTPQSLTLKHKIISLLCSTKDEAVHNFGCPVVSKVPFFGDFFFDCLHFLRHFEWHHTLYPLRTTANRLDLLFDTTVYWIIDFFAVYLPGAKFKVRICSFICSSLEANASLAGPFRHPISDCLHRFATPRLNQTDFVSLVCANQIGFIRIWIRWLKSGQSGWEIGPQSLRRNSSERLSSHISIRVCLWLHIHGNAK